MEFEYFASCAPAGKISGKTKAVNTGDENKFSKQKLEILLKGLGELCTEIIAQKSKNNLG